MMIFVSTSTLVGSWRPGGQHDRLRGPDHPTFHRHRGVLPERAIAAAEPGAGDADAPGSLTAVAEEEAASAASVARRSQVRTVDRSERIRTYNFPRAGISPTTGSVSRPTTLIKC